MTILTMAGSVTGVAAAIIGGVMAVAGFVTVVTLVLLIVDVNHVVGGDVPVVVTVADVVTLGVDCC